MKNLIKSLLIISFIFVSVTTSIAADKDHRAVMGTQRSSSSGQYTFRYGVYSRNWVMGGTLDLTSPDGQHVNSVYVFRNTSNYVEIGWYQSYGSSIARAFSVSVIGGVYKETGVTSGIPALGSTPRATWVKLQIHSTPGTDDWKTFINNVSMQSWNNTGFTSAYPQIGTERYYPGDTNSATFTEVKVRDGNLDSSWKYWDNIVRYPTTLDDPDWYLHDHDAEHYATVEDY